MQHMVLWVDDIYEYIKLGLVQTQLDLPNQPTNQIASILVLTNPDFLGLKLNCWVCNNTAG